MINVLNNFLNRKSMKTSPRGRPSLAENKKSKKLSSTSPVLMMPAVCRGHNVKIPQFGCFSPNWTIGSSRKAPRPPDETPGPGEYEIQPPLRSPKSGRTIGPRREISDRTVTSDIDIPNIRAYPANRPVTVGTRSTTYFYIPTDGAGNYIKEKSTLSPRAHRIALRIEEKPNGNPGPGAYSPDYSQKPKMTTIDRTLNRDVFKPAEPDIPGPGSYNLRPRIKTHRWFRNRRVTKMDSDE